MVTLLLSAGMAALQTPTLPDVAFQIEAMVMADQEVRNRLISMMQAGKKLTIEMVHEQDKVDRANTLQLRQWVTKHGWLTPKLVGKQGSHDTWLLVQHADLDPRFQERCLKLMEPLTRTGDVKPQDYAYLFDRVACAQGKPQRYGTQFSVVNGKLILKPTEDLERLDARRKQLGMMPMAQYRKLAEQAFTKK